ncbi:MAG: tRNA 2-thiouridine(34) synthase MnmA [Candidatus Cloacimonas sp.]|jgi:tRNA-specific 2-thiouridylase|nr:tRNA 2-thiouridine(34) synthase MnmA [Candidatus Cloacimonas sp.]
MKTVALGISGGIDSTMAALILMEQGYNVIGITMAKWTSDSGIVTQDKRGCFGPGELEALEAAKKACERLGIPFHQIDLHSEFSAEVLSYYSDTFMQGRTPNPCVVCNSRIKFGLLPQKARAMGLKYDYFATGHYASINFSTAEQRWQIIQAKDSSKDQSYFLGFLSQEQLARTLFPLGNMLKSEIREFALAHGYEYLIKKRESQDFLESKDASSLFPHEAFTTGDFIDVRGRVLGKHNGIFHYTIGQRKHLGIAGFAEPMYVLAIDAAKNNVVLGTIDALTQQSMTVTPLNWVSIAPLKSPLKCKAKIRQAHQAADCVIKLIDANTLQVEFAEPQLSITPGQLAAFYLDGVMLVAGIIN